MAGQNYGHGYGHGQGNAGQGLGHGRDSAPRPYLLAEEPETDSRSTIRQATHDQQYQNRQNQQHQNQQHQNQHLQAQQRQSRHLQNHILPSSHPSQARHSSSLSPAAYSSPLQQDSVSSQPTVIPRVPSPSQPDTDSTSEIYGPERLFGDPSAPPPTYTAHPHPFADSPSPEPAVRFDEAQLAMFAADNATRMFSIKDELALAASRVTPGVDDTPYIQYAIEALTRERSSVQEKTYPRFSRPSSRRPYDEEMGYSPVAVPAPARVDTRTHDFPHHDDVDEAEDEEASAANVDVSLQPPRLEPRIDEQTLQTSSFRDAKLQPSNRYVPISQDMRDSMDPHEKTYPPLTYKPRILRPFSMMILMALCLVLVILLIAAAVYSNQNSGLTPYPGSIYSGLYVVFRILPQLLSAVVFLYAQAIFAATRRVLPFAALAKDDSRGRYMALFRELYAVLPLKMNPRDPWQVSVFNAALLLACFAIPLQSAAFTCILVNGRWVWAPVQGVVWTLAVLYITVLAATSILMVFWFGHWTGLLWDMRSIADIIPMLNRGNTMASFERLDGLARTSDDIDLKQALQDRWFDRLGYWRTEDMLTGGIWWALGFSGVGVRDSARSASAPAKRASAAHSIESAELAIPTNLAHGTFKYLPPCLRTLPLALSIAISATLLLALLVVSFLPQTALESGFDPLLSARPASGAFSAANFLYSFLPSLLGMVPFLLYQRLDLALRVLQPWGELRNPDGGPARRTILADYAACLPLQSTSRAVRNGHWRVAFTSLAAVLFVFVPVLAGGLLMALTTDDGAVRMYANMPVFGVLLALLFLYLAALAALLPGRRQLRLPRDVTSLAGVISLCASEDLVQDAAFRSVRSRDDLVRRLGVPTAGSSADARDESVWFYGMAPGREEQRFAVRRFSRFTEKKWRSPRSSRSSL